MSYHPEELMNFASISMEIWGNSSTLEKKGISILANVYPKTESKNILAEKVVL